MDGSLSRFGPLVQGDAGRRFAHAKAAWGVDMPPFSEDPFEQWLVEEALMTRYAEETRLRDEERHAREDAQRQAREILDQHARGRDGR